MRLMGHHGGSMAWLPARSFGFDLVGGKGWQHHLWMRHSKHSWRSKRAGGGGTAFTAPAVWPLHFQTLARVLSFEERMQVSRAG